MADVCLLLLPIPKMAKAIGMCLRAGKYVISEKPVCCNSYESQSLWDTVRFLRAGHRWAVSENWAFKPSVCAARRLIQQEILRQRQKPTSYHLELVQCLDNSSWRRCGHQYYNGGACRDVGVHCIRALRCLFGEVEDVDNSSFVADEETCLLGGTLLHGHNGISGTLHLELLANLNRSREWACLVVDFGVDCQIIWDIGKGSFHRVEPDKGTLLLETVQGDSWVAGGVRELLTATMNWFHESKFGRNIHSSPQHAGLSCPMFTPEEAFRDASVVDTMLADCGRNNIASEAQHKLVDRHATGVRRNLPTPLLSRLNRSFANSLGTSSFRPEEIAWCASINDVVSAVDWANEYSLRLTPLGTCHSSCLFENGCDDICVASSLMSHVFDFRTFASAKLISN